MVIPKSFRLGSKTFRVNQPRTMPYGKVGEVHYKMGVIRVAQYRMITPAPTFGSALVKYEGGTYIYGALTEPRSDTARAETFWHETVHAILYDMEHKLWRNEKFVTEFSKRLNQVIHTAKLP